MARRSCSPYVFLALLPLCVPLTACGEDTSTAAAGGASSTGGAAGARAGSAGTSAIGGAGGGAGQSQGGTAGSAQGGTSGSAGESSGGGEAGSSAGGAAGESGAAGKGTAGNAATAGQGGGGSGSEVPPTTCSQAHGYPGCCSADRKTLYYFGQGEVLSEECGAGICTWGRKGTFYECGANDDGADPTGEYPLSCNTPLGFLAEGCTAEADEPLACPTGNECRATPLEPVCDAATKTCSGDAEGACNATHGEAGCCSADGKTIYFWDGLRVRAAKCKDGQACSWNVLGYECVTGPASPDPDGVFPLLCAAPIDPTKTGCGFRCESSGDCALVTNKPICDTPTHACVECTTNADCKDSNKSLCLSTSRTCVACTSSFDCKDPTKPACDERSNQCVAASQCTGDDLLEDANDGPSSAPDVTPAYGSPASITGHSICGLPAAEADYFKIVVQDADELTVSLDWADLKEDLDLTVLSSDNRDFGFDYFRRPSRVHLTHLPAGTYYIVVTRYDEPAPKAASTPYTLAIARTAGAKCTSTADCLADNQNAVGRASCTPAGACAFVEGKGAVAKDGVCDSGDDCASNFCALLPFSTNAAASAFCSVGCTNDDQCGGARVCTTTFETNFCVEKCTKDSDCPHNPDSPNVTGGQPWHYAPCEKSTGRCLPFEGQ